MSETGPVIPEKIPFLLKHAEHVIVLVTFLNLASLILFCSSISAPQPALVALALSLTTTILSGIILNHQSASKKDRSALVTLIFSAICLGLSVNCSLLVLLYYLPYPYPPDPHSSWPPLHEKIIVEGEREAYDRACA